MKASAFLSSRWSARLIESRLNAFPGVDGVSGDGVLTLTLIGCWKVPSSMVVCVCPKASRYLLVPLGGGYVPVCQCGLCQVRQIEPGPTIRPSSSVHGKCKHFPCQVMWCSWIQHCIVAMHALPRRVLQVPLVSNILHQSDNNYSLPCQGRFLNVSVVKPSLSSPL